METLEKSLKAFKPRSEEELTKEFNKLAVSFLYGGYISINDHKGEERYRIYIRTVEFYCHHEGEDKNLPKDPIVYHRNGRYVEGDVPYFPFMAFHAHASGYDITFENEKLALRSSALIRAYEVYDVRLKAFLTYKGKWVVSNNTKERINKQSTYLYDFLNGFASDSIKWNDEERKCYNRIKIDHRRNVYKYGNDGNKTNEIDDRPWSFTRQDEIEL